MAWYYFTGKKTDDESGLIYFGARYYDPSLGRFITPDDTVQDPTNPITLNRYQYAGNNPVNNIDPDGRSFWKKLWGAVKATFKYIHNPVEWNPTLHGIVTGDWSYAKDMAIAGATGFLFGGPVGAAAAMATTAVMRTPIAKFYVETHAKYVNDNIFGMSPEVAYTVSYLQASTALNLGFESAFAGMMAAPGEVSNFDINNPEHMKVAREAGYGYNSFGSKPTNPTTDIAWFDNANLKVITGKNGKTALFGAKPYGSAVHTGASSSNFPKALNMKYPSGLLGKFQKGTTFGFCHQAANATLLNAGFSNVATQLSGNYSTFVTTALYGNYGGGLVQKAYSGYQANRNWEKGGQ